MQTEASGLLYRLAEERLEHFTSPAVSILYPEMHPALADIARHTPAFVQPYRERYLQLCKQFGFKPEQFIDNIAQPIDLAIHFPGKHKQRNLADMAEALLHLKPGGHYMAACPNDQGGKSYAKHLKELCGEVETLSKYHCRFFQTSADNLNRELAEAWKQAGKMQRVEELNMISRPGLFSWNRPDEGSKLLADHLPVEKLSGRGLDLCCGYGYLTVELLKRASGITAMQLLDHDRFALEAAKSNVNEFSNTQFNFKWLDASVEVMDNEFDFVICNPPFHDGKAQEIDLGRAIVRAACQALKPGGSLCLVANRHLPYEALLHEHAKKLTVLAETPGFKVMEMQR